MHVLLAGATGAVSRGIVRLLLARGHRVTGLTRSVEPAEGLRVVGAHAGVVDVVEGSALTAVVRASAPDGILHQLTDLTGEDRSANARLRVVGTRNLVNAAQAAGATRIVAQSIAFASEDGPAPATEDVALRPGTPGIPGLEAAAADLPDWVVERDGLFDGPGTWYAADGVWAQRARAGELIADESVTSWIHVDDAAAADDEPATGREWVPVFWATPPPRAPTRIPGARGADNGRARALGWRPAAPSWRTGFRAPAKVAS